MDANKVSITLCSKELETKIVLVYFRIIFFCWAMVCMWVIKIMRPYYILNDILNGNGCILIFMSCSFSDHNKYINDTQVMNLYDFEHVLIQINCDNVFIPFGKVVRIRIVQIEVCTNRTDKERDSFLYNDAFGKYNISFDMEILNIAYGTLEVGILKLLTFFETEKTNFSNDNLNTSSSLFYNIKRRHEQERNMLNQRCSTIHSFKLQRSEGLSHSARCRVTF